MFKKRITPSTGQIIIYWIMQNFGFTNTYPLNGDLSGPSFSKGKSLSSGYCNKLLVSLILIHWILIYLMDSAIDLLNNWGLVDNTFHMWLNYNLGKVNLETTLAGQRVSPRQIGLCRVAAESAWAYK